ncbi:hypothetical protein Taro_041953 [Colocasia esculenta]|uniref:Nudix hydrolase domain-containing protein n=1 Tax=Colocasia esculenta TaxID=4460 RepID=A0A843WRD4_COLES|nr:hypothetical protein [Colocasia esculenta]
MSGRMLLGLYVSGKGRAGGAGGDGGTGEAGALPSLWGARDCATMTLLARTGRHRQRYDDDHRRLVAGATSQAPWRLFTVLSSGSSLCMLSSLETFCTRRQSPHVARTDNCAEGSPLRMCIPYRVKQNVEDHTMHLVHRLEVLMISSPNRDDLVFPKGGWEDDETVHEAACREALEEAGVSGVIHVGKECLGVWEFRSKSRQSSCSLEGSCRGYMFALQVTEELDSWPEETCHKRRWLSVSEAKNLCRYPWMGEALENCVRLLNQVALHPSEPSRHVKPSEPQSLDSTRDARIAAPLEAFC